VLRQVTDQLTGREIRFQITVQRSGQQANDPADSGRNRNELNRYAFHGRLHERAGLAPHAVEHEFQGHGRIDRHCTTVPSSVPALALRSLMRLFSSRSASPTPPTASIRPCFTASWPMTVVPISRVSSPVLNINSLNVCSDMFECPMT